MFAHLQIVPVSNNLRARREYTIVTYATTLPHVLKQRLSVDILINDNGRFPILSVRPLNTISIRIACKS